MLKTTRKGRVVYNRPPTKFTCKDVLRIARAVYNTREDLRGDVFCWIDVFRYVFQNVLVGAKEAGQEDNVKEILTDMISRVENYDEEKDYQFGGGGATGGV